MTSISRDQLHELASDGIPDPSALRATIEVPLHALVVALEEGFKASTLDPASYTGYLAIAYGREVAQLFAESHGGNGYFS